MKKVNAVEALIHLDGWLNKLCWAISPKVKRIARSNVVLFINFFQKLRRR